MSLSGTDEVNDPIEEKNAVEENDLNQPQRRGKIIREAMRDVLISVILLVLTTLVTYGDFEKSPASSILASGKLNSTPHDSIFFVMRVTSPFEFSGNIWVIWPNFSQQNH